MGQSATDGSADSGEDRRACDHRHAPVFWETCGANVGASRVPKSGPRGTRCGGEFAFSGSGSPARSFGRRMVRTLVLPGSQNRDHGAPPVVVSLHSQDPGRPPHIATGRVPHVVHLAHGVRRMVKAAVLEALPVHLAGRRRRVWRSFGDPPRRTAARPGLRLRGDSAARRTVRIEGPWPAAPRIECLHTASC